jgi:hypothetical protein
MRFEISRHAHDEMNRRALTGELVGTILRNPQQIVAEYGGKKSYQSIIRFGAGKDYLVRVLIDDSVDPAKVITVYRTRKIKKYWRQA